MLKILASCLPQTLRARLLLVIIPVISLSIIAAGYLLTVAGKDAILQEKRSHLLGVTHVLALELKSQGGFATLEQKIPAASTERTQRIKHLNEQLASATEQLAQACPGVGVG